MTPPRPPRSVTDLRSAVGWPLRRVLNPRVQWTVAEVDARLGSRHDQVGARPPIHDRLDALDATLAALGGTLAGIDARLAAVEAAIAVLVRDAELERATTEEALAAMLEGLRLVESRLAEREPAEPAARTAPPRP